VNDTHESNGNQEPSNGGPQDKLSAHARAEAHATVSHTGSTKSVKGGRERITESISEEHGQDGKTNRKIERTIDRVGPTLNHTPSKLRISMRLFVGIALFAVLASAVAYSVVKWYQSSTSGSGSSGQAPAPAVPDEPDDGRFRIAVALIPSATSPAPADNEAVTERVCGEVQRVFNEAGIPIRLIPPAAKIVPSLQDDGANVARKLGAEVHASLVVWGRYNVSSQQQWLHIEVENLTGELPAPTLLKLSKQSPEVLSLNFQTVLNHVRPPEQNVPSLAESYVAFRCLVLYGLIQYRDKAYQTASRAFEAAEVYGQAHLSNSGANAAPVPDKDFEAVSAWAALAKIEMAPKPGISIDPSLEKKMQFAVASRLAKQEYDAGNFSLADEYVQFAMSANPTHPGPYRFRAGLRNTLRMYDGVIADANMALRLMMEPYDPPAIKPDQLHLLLGEAWLARREYQTALTEFLLVPESPDVLVWRQVAARCAKNDDALNSAAELLKQAVLAKKISADEVQAKLGMALVIAGALDQGIESLDLATRTNPKAGYFEELGKAYVFAGKKEQAADAFRRADALRPATPVDHRYGRTALLVAAGWLDLAEDEIVTIEKSKGIVDRIFAYRMRQLYLQGRGTSDVLDFDLSQALDQSKQETKEMVSKIDKSLLMDAEVATREILLSRTH